MTYDVGNPVLVLGQAQKCGRVKLHGLFKLYSTITRYSIPCLWFSPEQK
jgi:hypothetical protein